MSVDLNNPPEQSRSDDIPAWDPRTGDEASLAIEITGWDSFEYEGRYDKDGPRDIPVFIGKRVEGGEPIKVLGFAAVLHAEMWDLSWDAAGFDNLIGLFVVVTYSGEVEFKNGNTGHRYSVAVSDGDKWLSQAEAKAHRPVGHTPAEPQTVAAPEEDTEADLLAAFKASKEGGNQKN